MPVLFLNPLADLVVGEHAWLPGVLTGGAWTCGWIAQAVLVRRREPVALAVHRDVHDYLGALRAKAHQVV